MTHRRLTAFCKLFPKGVKGISPDDSKTISKKDIMNQTIINNKFNTHANELGDKIIKELKDVDITWITDGSFIISTSSTVLDIQKCLKNNNLDIQPDRSDIHHKVKHIDPDDITSKSYEDIDEVITQDPTKAKNILKKKSRINDYKRLRV